MHNLWTCHDVRCYHLSLCSLLCWLSCSLWGFKEVLSLFALNWLTEQHRHKKGRNAAKNTTDQSDPRRSATFTLLPVSAVAKTPRTCGFLPCYSCWHPCHWGDLERLDHLLPSVHPEAPHISPRTAVCFLWGGPGPLLLSEPALFLMRLDGACWPRFGFDTLLVWNQLIGVKDILKESFDAIFAPQATFCFSIHSSAHSSLSTLFASSMKPGAM